MSRAEDGSPSFGQLLRGHRRAVGLTQEALAERAGLSWRAIQHLEADESRPYPDTVRRLVEALRLSSDDRKAFEAAARPQPAGSGRTSVVPQATPEGRGRPKTPGAASPDLTSEPTAPADIFGGRIAGPPTRVQPRRETPVGLPGGTVTFLLTNLEGSTALWEEAAEAMQAALIRHDALFEAAVHDHEGVHIRPRGEGDSRFAVFATAPQAVAAALAIQRAFARESWPTSRPIKVRIGIHTGEAEPRDGDYDGAAVNRCA